MLVSPSRCAPFSKTLNGFTWSGVETRNCDSSYTTPGYDGSTSGRAQRSLLSAFRMHTLVCGHQ